MKSSNEMRPFLDAALRKHAISNLETQDPANPLGYRIYLTRRAGKS